MYLRNIAISNYHTFTYHPELILTKGMEFDTDPYTSNVNILIWPNGSGKSNFLDLLTLLCDLHILPDKGGGPLAVEGLSQKLPIKKHSWFESYPTTILAQRVIWWASEEHSITIRYDLDDMTYEVISGASTISPMTYDLLGTSRIPTISARSPVTIELIRDHLWLIYNPINQSYITASWAIRKRDDLGSGEQSIVRMIQQIVESSNIGGIIMIDEPELHLHPQYQVQLWAILELLSQRQNIQIIIATHSPIFINDDNVVNVFRFTPTDGHTHMINPVSFRGQEQARIRQILTDWNMAKLFFADHIIMVEWDTDEYFLHHYIKQYFALRKLQARRYNYEILNIAGKSSLRAWRSFCKQFEINRSFIGDWDNVVNSEFGAEIEAIKRRVPHHAWWHKLTKSQQYSLLIQQISDHHISLEQRISTRIDRQAKHHSYTLRHGDLEAYLWLHDKWLDVTIDWCNTSLSQRIQNPQYQHYRSDLDNILDKIFHVKSD